MIRFILILLVITSFTACDAELKARKRAKKAFEYYSNDDKLKAAKMFHKLVLSYPQSNFYGKNLFNAAYIYQEIDSFDVAIRLYNRILREPLDDNEPDSSRRIGFTRTNYKHFAAENLGKIYNELGDHRKSLQYLYMAKSDFPFRSDSALYSKQRELAIDIMIADTYLKMGKKDSALIIVLQDALVESPWNKNVAKEYALNLIKEHFTPKLIYDELIDAFENVKQYPTFVKMPFLQYELIVIPFQTPAQEMDRAYFRTRTIYVDLYRMIYY